MKKKTFWYTDFSCTDFVGRCGGRNEYVKLKNRVMYVRQSGRGVGGYGGWRAHGGQTFGFETKGLGCCPQCPSPQTPKLTESA